MNDEAVPAVTAPAMTVPAVTLPSVTLPSVTVPVAPSSVTNVYIQSAPPPVALRPKSAGIAYFAMGFSLVGLCGMQHFYLGKLGQGVLWLITFGLFGFGTVTDLFTLRSQTKTINARRALGIA